MKVKTTKGDALCIQMLKDCTRCPLYGMSCLCGSTNSRISKIFEKMKTKFPNLEKINGIITEQMNEEVEIDAEF